MLLDVEGQQQSKQPVFMPKGVADVVSHTFMGRAYQAVAKEP
jgi:hypothetical protein